MLEVLGDAQPALRSEDHHRAPVDLFNQPNLERQLRHDRAHGTRRFGANQIDVATMWQRIEEEPPASSVSAASAKPTAAAAVDVRVRNQQQWLTESGVDVQSCVQMMFDIFTQTIDVSTPNHTFRYAHTNTLRL